MDKTLAQQVDALAHVLQRQVAVHEELLALMKRKREALRSANPDAVAELCGLENERLRAAAELEKQRAELTAQVTLAVVPGAKAPLRLGDLAERLAEPSRGRLLVLRSQLRERMERVREGAAIARSATESLVRHVGGLVQSVTRLASQGTTYGNRGETPAAVRTISMTA